MHIYIASSAQITYLGFQIVYLKWELAWRKWGGGGVYLVQNYSYIYLSVQPDFGAKNIAVNKSEYIAREFS